MTHSHAARVGPVAATATTRSSGLWKVTSWASSARESAAGLDVRAGDAERGEGAQRYRGRQVRAADARPAEGAAYRAAKSKTSGVLEADKSW